MDDDNEDCMNGNASRAIDFYEPFPPYASLFAPPKEYRYLLEKYINLHVVNGFYQYQEPAIIQLSSDEEGW